MEELGDLKFRLTHRNYTANIEQSRGLVDCPERYVSLLVPNKEALLRWLKGKGLSVKTPEGQEAALWLLEAELGAFREGGGHAGMFPARWLPSAVASSAKASPNRTISSTRR